MKNLVYILFLLSTVLSCKKEKKQPFTPTSGTGGSGSVGNFSMTVIDNQNGSPVQGAYVSVAYGNSFSSSDTTGADGKVLFNIPYGWVLNTITISKADFCTYHTQPNSTFFDREQTININHYAYLRYHVKNIAPAMVSDGMVIYGPHPTSLSSGYEFDFYGAGIDSTFISPSLAGSLGISCNNFTGSTFTGSFYIWVTAVSGDTTDVLVEY